MIKLSSVCIFLLVVCFSSAAKILVAEASDVSAKDETDLGSNGDPRFAFSQPYVPLDGVVKNFNGTLGNSTIPVNFNPIPTSVLLAKKGLLTVLSLFKAILPQIILVVLFAISVVVVIGYFFGLFSDWGAPLSVRGENLFEPDIYRRNAFENDHNKFRPILQGIEDHKFKYNHISHD